MNKWIFSVLVLSLFSSTQAAPFLDRMDFPSWGEAAIETVKEEGIMSGFGDGTFRPHQKLTRAESVTLLLRAKKDIVNDYNGISRFPDVPSGVWFEKAVGIAASNGWVKGRPDGSFYPGDNLTRAEFATLVARTFNLKASNPEALPFEDLDTNSWYTESIAALYEHELLRNARNRYFRPEHIVSRAEAAWTFALIATKPGINGTAGDVSYGANGYSDSRRVAIKPRNFEDHKQGYDIERKAIHVGVDIPEEEVEVLKESDWQNLGNIRFRNTLDYRADIEHIQFYLRFEKSGTGPSNAFEIKLSGAGFEKVQQIYRNGEVTFTGMDHRVDEGSEVVFNVEIRLHNGTSYYSKEGKGMVYVKDVGGEAFKPFSGGNSSRTASISIAPIEYNTRNLQNFVFKP